MRTATRRGRGLAIVGHSGEGATSPPARVAQAARICRSVDCRIAWTEPSAKSTFSTPVWGEKKSYGSDHGSLNALFHTRAMTMVGAGGAPATESRAFGGVWPLPRGVTPAHAAPADQAPRSAAP